MEASHIALMRDDWRLVPEVFAIAQRTLQVVKMNFAFTILYNTFGLLLAAFGILPPVLAAVAQSLPDSAFWQIPHACCINVHGSEI